MTFDAAMHAQADFCAAAGAPIVARICRALPAALDDDSATGRRVRAWPGDPIRDALPLRLIAPFHALFRARACAALDPLFCGDATDDVAAIAAAVAAHDGWIAAWLDGPPQTNEPARSAAFMAALLVLAKRFGHAFELLEIGSSAGLNLLIDRYRYVLGTTHVGPAASPVTIAPEWRGRSPEPAPVVIGSVAGVDIAPVDVTEAAAAARLLAYVWVDATERITRVERAIAMFTVDPPPLARGDAAAWVEPRLARPQAPGTTRVLMHSVVWPYLTDAGRARITAAMETAGSAATADRPLAWLRFEWDSHHSPHAIRLRSWPSGDDRLLGHAHPHGAWVDWSGEEGA